MALYKILCLISAFLILVESRPPTCNFNKTLVQLKVYNDHAKDGRVVKCHDQSLKRQKIKVVMHGFQSSGESMLEKNAWRAARQKFQSLIIVNWEQLAKPDPSSGRLYRSAAKCAIEVGEYLAKCLSTMNVVGKNLHLFGHSLGAHGVGKAGRELAKINIVPARVTGMDPAGPCFSHHFKDSFSAKLAKFGLKSAILPGVNYCSEGENLETIGQDSGRYVDIVHSNPGVWGTAVPLGHNDYYVNGGTSVHSECPGDPSSKNAHSYAVKIVVEALRHNKLVKKTKKNKGELAEIKNYNQYSIGCKWKKTSPYCTEIGSVEWIFDLKKHPGQPKTTSLHSNARC